MPDRRSLRPRLDTEPTSQPAEAFQNDTLRPVLKLQHEHLLAVFQHFLIKRKVDLSKLPAARRAEKIAELLTRDNRLRGLLFGLVVGLFEGKEVAYYLQNEREVNQRLTSLLTQRLLSVLG